MSQHSTGDVDRAMAAFAASPIGYRNFALMPVGPVEGQHLPSGAVAAAQPQLSEQALVFPLLLAALPEVALIPVPPAPAGGHAAPDQKPVTTAARPLEATPSRSIMQSARIDVPPERPVILQRPDQTMSPRGPFRQALATVPMRVAVGAAASVRGHTTPLGAMFQALHTAAASQPNEAEAGAKPNLQNLFSLL